MFGRVFLFLFLTGNCQKDSEQPDKVNSGSGEKPAPGLKEDFSDFIESYGKDLNEQWLEQKIHAKLFGGKVRLTSNIEPEVLLGDDKNVEIYPDIYRREVRPFDVGQAPFENDELYNNDQASFIKHICFKYQRDVKIFEV